jgi:hypothetical protein
MVDRAVIHEELSQKSTEYLAEMVRLSADTSDQWTPEAIEVATLILTSRGLSVERAPPMGPTEKRAAATEMRAGGMTAVLVGFALMFFGITFSFVISTGFIWYGAILTGLVLVLGGLASGDKARQLEAQAAAVEPPPAPDPAPAPARPRAPTPAAAPPKVGDDPWSPPGG